MNMIENSDRIPLQASSTDNLVPTSSRMFPSRTTEYPRVSDRKEEVIERAHEYDREQRSNTAASFFHRQLGPHQLQNVPLAHHRVSQGFRSERRSYRACT